MAAAAGPPEGRAWLRRERAVALGIATLLVIARSLLFALYEQAFFNSDQAIVGLMAKHLSEGRAFPLFFYGQPYMLAVESWLAAPWFLIAPAGVATLRASLILTNVAAAWLIVMGLERWGQLRPLQALMASMFFVFPPPVTSAFLVEAQGGNIEPFVYVALLWFLRRRPFAFGATLAIGFLNREFTIFAVPALLSIEAWQRRLLKPEAIQRWLVVLVAFLAVWEGVQALKPYADMMGPGTRGALLRGAGGSQIANIAGRSRVAPSEFGSRLTGMLRDHIPALLGLRRYDQGFGQQGHDWMAWPASFLALCALARLAALGVRELRRPGVARADTAAFGWFLLCVGLAAAAGYVATRPITLTFVRYGLLVLLIPLGLTALLLAYEPRGWVRSTIVLVIAVWASLSAFDHVALWRTYLAGHRPNELRMLSDALVQRGVDVAVGDYWTAYALTFVSRERIKVASSDFVRVQEYQDLADRRGTELVEIRLQPCDAGERIARWYLCRVGS